MQKDLPLTELILGLSCLFSILPGAETLFPLTISSEKPSTPFKEGLDTLLGPEVYQVDRRREGGTKQQGCLVGGRALIHYRRSFCLYWGLEGACAWGKLRGRSENDARIQSHLFDASLEGRLGYCFRTQGPAQLTLIPFVGGGYLWENNNFCHPTPLNLHFGISYGYATAGALTSMNLSPDLNVGFNIKIRLLLQPRCRISNDPEFRPTTLKFGDEYLQYRLEWPLLYRRDFNCLKFALTPFYEARVYGSRADYPFDFMKTRLHNYGASLMADISF